jgi:hypothetical protein
LKLAGILNQHDTIRGLGHLGEESIDEGRLAGRGAAGDKDIAAIGDGRAQCCGLP